MSRIVLPDNINVVWTPLKGRVVSGKYCMSSQELALTCPCDIIVLTGSRATGKTEVSLIKFALDVGKGYGSYYRGVYIDLHYKDLADVIARSKRLYPLIFGKKARFYSSKGDEKWVWDTGEELLFRQGGSEDDYERFHGQEYTMIMYNEISKNPSPAFFDKMKTTARTSFNPKEHPYWVDRVFYAKYHIEKHVPKEHPNAEIRFLPPLRPRILVTTNPSGAGKQWVKQRFIDPAPAGKIIRKVVKAYNPQTRQEEEMVKTQVHIFSSYKENYHLSPEYVLELESIEDPELRKAWLFGDWNCSFGDGMFNDIFRTGIHVVMPFRIPDTWQIYRGFDWGWSKPFATIWVAISDGSSVETKDGTKRNTVRGDAFVFMEYYGCVKGKPNTGLCMLARDVAKNIIMTEIHDGYYGKTKVGIADSAIFSKEDDHCIADEMLERVRIGDRVYSGLNWIGANKKSGSRSVGWELIRKRLRNSVPDKVNGITLPREKAGLFFFNTCTECLRTIPNIDRDPKKDFDLDTNSEDHLADALRYLVSYIDWDGKTQRSYGMA